MKMAKPTTSDIDAGGELMSLLDLLDGRFGGPYGSQDCGENLFELLERTEECFDYENVEHLKTLANHLAKLMRQAPGFAMRIIAGMCYVILFEQNKIVDPSADTLELHPDIKNSMADADRYRWAIASEDNANLLLAAVRANGSNQGLVSQEVDRNARQTLSS
ncbi:hypothetical protein PuT2_14165 [Pusillimonas sp. T2]|uniref:hypothetical protein n=1 Tax=Pusillimonas sp. T2 TaxID=1548123 RepID=UPI000B9CB1D6|nr:hypothetical protein [Pusillimonas sp. T2]OXR48164.1 hypothetical protein PuT2_14165 [Pusillimonas sp. T2]